MKERNITEAEANVVIETPDFTEPSLKGRMNAFKFHGERYLRVTYRQEPADTIVVITAVARKKPFESA